MTRFLRARPTRLALAVALTLAAQAPARAADKVWNCQSQFFDTAACWQPAGVPQAGDNLRLLPYLSGGNRLPSTMYLGGVFHDNDVQVADILVDGPQLSQDASGRGVTLRQTAGQLTARHLTVAELGVATAEQRGSIGLQSLRMSVLVGSDSRYFLVNGTLDSGSSLVGLAGQAVFLQTDGLHRTGQLAIATDAGGSGSYRLTGGRVEAVSVSVGGAGIGLFEHAGGTLALDDAMAVAAGSRYQLWTGGLLTMPGNTTVLNQGSFELLGGRLVGTLENEGHFVFGTAGSATPAPQFSGRLVNRGTVALAASGSLADGLRNEAVFDGPVTGRALALDGTGLDNAGELRLAGGTLHGTGALRNSGRLVGHGRVAGSGGIFNDGTWQQEGGSLVLANTAGVQNRGTWVGLADRELQLSGAGVAFANRGQLLLAGGRITGSGTLENLADGVLSGGGTVTTRLINAGSLALAAGDRLTVGGVFVSTGLIDLGGAGASLAGSLLSNHGLITGQGRIANAIDNAAAGRVQADGGVLALAGTVTNAGLMSAGRGGTLLLQGALTQQGRLHLDGGTLDLTGRGLVNQGVVSGFGTLRAGELVNQQQVLLSGGNTQVLANLDQQSGALLVVSGGAVASFQGTVRARAGSELRVSEGSGAVFLAAVSQENGALFSGSGTHWFEGGLSVGNSPGDGGVGGDAVFGVANLYRAEIGGAAPGTGFDRFSAGGHLQFGGGLQLSWWGDFRADAGQRFDLFDWGRGRGGQFSRIDLSAAPLADGLRWDLSRLYLDGSLAVAAVPEPDAWALMLSGLGVLGWRAGRRRPATSAGPR